MGNQLQSHPAALSGNCADLEVVCMAKGKSEEAIHAILSLHSSLILLGKRESISEKILIVDQD
jgi:hypothetical protein